MFFSCNDFTGGHEIQAKPLILRHFYSTSISLKILTTKYPLRSTFNRKLWRYPLQVRRQTQSCTITPRPWLAACLPLARSAASRSYLNRTVISFLATLCYIFKLLCNWCQICHVFERFLDKNSHSTISQRGRGNFTYLLEAQINFALKLSVGCLISQF